MDEDVEAPEALEDLLHEPGGRAGRGEVGPDGGPFRSTGRKQRQCLLGGGPVRPVVDRHAIPGLTQPQRQLPPEPTPGPRDESDLHRSSFAPPGPKGPPRFDL